MKPPSAEQPARGKKRRLRHWCSQSGSGRRKRQSIEPVPLAVLTRFQAWTLKQLRIRHKLTQKEVAQRARVGLTTLKRYERDRRGNSFIVIYSLGLVLHYSPDEIYRITVRWLDRYATRERLRLDKGRDWWPRPPRKQKSRAVKGQ